MDPQDQMRIRHIKRQAIGLLGSPIRHCEVSLLFYQIWSTSWHGARNQNAASYSALDQSIPAGHRRAPVRLWWYPRSILTLRARGGVKTWPEGTIQSRMGPFRLLVSSDLAPETPFWSYDKRMNGILKWTKEVPSQQWIPHCPPILLKDEPRD